MTSVFISSQSGPRTGLSPEPTGGCSYEMLSPRLTAKIFKGFFPRRYLHLISGQAARNASRRDVHWVEESKINLRTAKGTSPIWPNPCFGTGESSSAVIDYNHTAVELAASLPSLIRVGPLKNAEWQCGHLLGPCRKD